MNIRAKILGSTRSPQEVILQSKKPKSGRPESLDDLIAREDARINHSRFEDRHRLLDEKVQLKHGRNTHEVDLINISGGGAMIGGDLRLKLWEKVQLNLGENGAVDCAVRWVRDGRFGLEFAHETRIDCGADEQASVLREVVRRSFPDLEFEADHAPERHAGPEVRGEGRHPLFWAGVLHHDYESTPVRLRNISTTGVMIECTAMLTVGSEPLLQLGPDLAVSTTVAWVLGDQAGLRFSSPFDLHDLARSRPRLAGAEWTPPDYLADDGAEADPDNHWGMMSLGQLRHQLEGFLKR